MTGMNLQVLRFIGNFHSTILLQHYAKHVSLFIAMICIYVLTGNADAQSCATVKLETGTNSIVSGTILHPKDSSITFRISPSDNQAYTITLNFKDETGKILSSRNENIQGSDWLVTSHLAGYNEAEISVLNLKTDQVCFEKTQSLAAIDKVSTSSPKFGIWEVNGDPKLVKAIGSGWSRKFWTLNCYRLVEGQLRCIPTNYENKKLKPVDGVSIIGTLGKGLPDFITEKKTGGKPYALVPVRDLNKLTQVAAQFAADQGGLPEYFELYNEPDVEWKGSNLQLVELEGAIAKGLKQVSPKTKILSASSWSIRMTYLTELINNGLTKHVDGIAVHAYADSAAPEKEFIGRIVSLRSYLDDRVKKGYPLFITEFGWTTGAGGSGVSQRPVSELTQAQYIARAALLIASQDIKAAIFFNLLWSKPPNAAEEGFSYLRLDGTPKPAFVSFATVLRWVGDWDRPGVWIKPVPGVHVVYSENGGVSRGAVWTEHGQAHITIPGKLLRLEDMMGRYILPDAHGALQISESPVYFEMSNALPTAIRVN